MKDGLYRVVTPYACFGFVMRRGHVRRAPRIFWPKSDYWRSIARWVCP